MPLYAYNIISFENYKNEAQQLILKNKQISKTELIQQLTDIKNSECTHEKESDLYYLVSPICLLKKDLPQADTTAAIEKLRPHIKGFMPVYNEVSTDFNYEGAKPFLYENITSQALLPITNEEKMTLIYLQKNNKTLRIPAEYFVSNTIKNFSYYTTKKDLTPLKRCTKQNYLVAFHSFEGLILQPGESLNMNKHLAYLKGYCKGQGSQDLMFYGGVCGFVTQLFRTSLLTPVIQITKRYPHSVWLVPYYSDYVFGDDAAIYQNSKQFEIKNNGNQPIYFKTIENEGFSYLVAIIPEKDTRRIKISKHEVENRKAEVIRSIYTKGTNELIDSETFTATYTQKAYSVQ